MPSSHDDRNDRRNWRPADQLRSGDMRSDDTNFRTDDRRAGIYGSVSQSDRTYDPNRFRPHEEAGYVYERSRENYDRERDWNRSAPDTNEIRRAGRGGRDFGYGTYGVSSGFRSGAEYGGYGRDSDFGAFERGDDLVFGSPFTGRAQGFARTDDRDLARERGQGDSRHYRDIDNAEAYGFRGERRDLQDLASQPFGSGPLESRGRYAGRGPKGYRRSDERIREEVCELLERHPRVDATDIEVEVKDAIVTLKGSVGNRLQKRMAEWEVEYVRGVKDIRNELGLANDWSTTSKAADDSLASLTAPVDEGKAKGKKAKSAATENASRGESK